MNSKLKPAIMGGLVVGFLSAIPFINWLNICCCLWAIIGGALASMVYIRNSPTAARAGDGAVLGVLAGLIGAAIFIILGIPISIAMGSAMTAIFGRIVESIDPDQAEMMRRQMEASQTMLGVIINGLITAILLVVFSTIGG